MSAPQISPAPRRFLGVSFKMYFDHDETLSWTDEVIGVISHDKSWPSRVDVVEFPSFPSIPAVVGLANTTGVMVGAQNLADSDEGPFTGEVSGRTLRQVGCSYVEVGHAERRLKFCEDDRVIGRKLCRAFQSGLTPLLCVGEPRDGSSGTAGRYCVAQVSAALAAMPDTVDAPSLVVAYEPVWAIGAAAPATEEHTRAVCDMVRTWLSAHRPDMSVRVVYGGSAGPGLYTRLAADVDGLFLGRFAHDPMAFLEILGEVAAVC